MYVWRTQAFGRARFGHQAWWGFGWCLVRICWGSFTLVLWIPPLIYFVTSSQLPHKRASSMFMTSGNRSSKKRGIRLPWGTLIMYGKRVFYVELMNHGPRIWAPYRPSPSPAWAFWDNKRLQYGTPSQTGNSLRISRSGTPGTFNRSVTIPNAFEIDRSVDLPKEVSNFITTATTAIEKHALVLPSTRPTALKCQMFRFPQWGETFRFLSVGSVSRYPTFCHGIFNTQKSSHFQRFLTK